MTHETLITQLTDLLGNASVRAAAEDTLLTDQRGRYSGKALCVLYPSDTAAVSAIVRLCHQSQTPMLPLGGNTSLCGAATPDENGNTVVISLSSLNRVRAVDALNNTITVEAGCTLASVQAAAKSVGLLFPLSLASEGSCQIGGNLSTNAGGLQVLRYGTMRDLVLGLEVVLPDGQCWSALRGLKKDNAGYDLKQLFIGAEGTLGIITAAVLKLFPIPKNCHTLWFNVATPSAAIQLLQKMRLGFDQHLSAFELISDAALSLVLQHIPDTMRPTPRSPWYVLIELSDVAMPALEDFFQTFPEKNAVILAQSASQAKKLWHLRESISEAQKREGLSIKHDISLPVSAWSAFLEKASEALDNICPGMRPVVFGHLGDGNLHYNVFPLKNKAASPENHARFFEALEARVQEAVHDLTHALGGSIAAEHGVGQLKRAALLRYKSPLELQLMQQIKNSLDPLRLMNPGKMLPDEMKP